jgi:hypothetical protein
MAHAATFADPDVRGGDQQVPEPVPDEVVVVQQGDAPVPGTYVIAP